MKARVYVMLKTGVLDPQGEAVRHALGTLGFDGVQGVRQGKLIELDLADGTDATKESLSVTGDLNIDFGADAELASASFVSTNSLDPTFPKRRAD